MSAGRGGLELLLVRTYGNSGVGTRSVYVIATKYRCARRTTPVGVLLMLLLVFDISGQDFEL